MEFLVLFIVPLAIGLWAQSRVTSTFRHWSEVPMPSGATGAEIARAILDRNGLHSVPVHHTPGDLSDHYDPSDRSVHLSDNVYGGRSVSAAAVAAHEVGHAIQHSKHYMPMSVRSAIFPAVALGSNVWMFLLMGGAILTAVSASPLGTYAIIAALAIYSVAVLFHIVTLPVEFDASRRARRELNELQLVGAGTGGDVAVGTGKVLNAAAMTYVAGALAAIAQLVYFALMFLGDE